MGGFAAVGLVVIVAIEVRGLVGVVVSDFFLLTIPKVRMRADSMMKSNKDK